MVILGDKNNSIHSLPHRHRGNGMLELTSGFADDEGNLMGVVDQLEAGG
jgi:hypothetical protein